LLLIYSVKMKTYSILLSVLLFNLFISRLSYAEVSSSTVEISTRMSYAEVSSTTVKNPIISEKPLSDRLALRSPEWIKKAVLYGVNLRSYSKVGKFHALESDMLKLQSRGIDAVVLMPIFQVGESTQSSIHGNPFLVKNYYGLNSEFGSKEGLRHLVEQAHVYGIKVILDWVADQSAQDSLFVEYEPNWFKLLRKEKTLSGQSPNDPVLFDYNSRTFRTYMIEAMSFWVEEYGIDGFRCHSADKVPNSFWRQARIALKRINPNIVLIAHGSKPEFHLDSFDVTSSDLLPRALKQIINGEISSDELENLLDQEEAGYPQGSLHMRYIEDYNMDRSINVFDQALFPSTLMMLTLGGVPYIFNGQEVGESNHPALTEKKVIDWWKLSKENSKLRKFCKKLVKLHGRNSAISRGQRFRVRGEKDDSIYVYARTYREDVVLVAVNFSDQEYKNVIEMPEIFLSKKGKVNLKSVFSDGLIQKGPKGKYVLVLPPWGYQIWLGG